MAYTTINNGKIYFNTITYTGNGTARNIDVGNNTDLIWIKRRDGTANHRLTDRVRGATNMLSSNNANATQTDAQTVTGFITNGFSLGTDSGGYDVNTSSQTYVGWSWVGGGSASSNTDGSITSSVSANTTAGFSIVSYTGNSTGSATFGHGLGSTPKIVIIKCRSLGTESWQFWFNNTSRLNLNATAASLTTHPISTNSTIVTTPSSSNDSWNTSGQTYIAYCFAEKKGFSKFGSYTGNGSTDGTFVYTGFKPAFVLTKSTSNAVNWQMQDNKTAPHNLMVNKLFANTTAAQDTGSENTVDFLSNGFKPRGTGSSENINGNGYSYIYMAFAENPFTSSTGTPVTAR